MLGIPVLTATDGQKSYRTDSTAKEQGLGEWAVKVASRSIVRIGD